MALPLLPSPARSSFGTARIGFSIYTVGGHINFTHTYPESNFTGQVDCYDIQSNTWLTTPFAPRPIPTQGFRMAAYGRYLYAFGGLKHLNRGTDQTKNYESITNIDQYDTLLNTWTTVANLPVARSSHCIVTAGSKVYMLGGWTGDPTQPSGGLFLNRIDTFDMATEVVGTESYLLPAPVRRAFTTIQMPNIGAGVLIGGISNINGFSTVKNVTYFNPAMTIPFQELTALPKGIFAPGSIYSPETTEMLVFGGWVGPKNVFTNQVLAYSFARPGIWSPKIPLKEERGFPEIVRLGIGQFGVLGGALNPAKSGPQSTAFDEYSLSQVNILDHVTDENPEPGAIYPMEIGSGA